MKHGGIMDRVKTGISGLDELLNGGIPAGSQVFVCGGPGTGKSTMGVEYLYRGAKAGENGLFFTLEEDPDSIIKMVEAVFPEWKDFKQLLKDGRIVVSSGEGAHLDKPASGTGQSAQYSFSKLLGSVQGLVEDSKAKRVVIDSSTIIKMFFGDGLEFRKTMLGLLRNLKRAGCTTLITSEIPSLDRGSFAFESEHFVADGLIVLYNLTQQEKRLSAVEILKMRKTAHSRALTPLKITPGGINVYVGEKVY